MGTIKRVTMFAVMVLVMQVLQATDGGVAKQSGASACLEVGGEAHQNFLADYPLIEPHVSRAQLAATRERLEVMKIMAGPESHRLMTLALAFATREGSYAAISSEFARTPEDFWLPVEIDFIASVPLTVSLLLIECEQLKKYMNEGNRQLGRYYKLLIQLISPSNPSDSKKTCCLCCG